MVLRVCMAVLDPADADQAWAQTFLAALRSYPDLPGGAIIDAWLVILVHRQGSELACHTAGQEEPIGHRRTPVARTRTTRATSTCWPRSRHGNPDSVMCWPTTTSPECPTRTSRPILGGTLESTRQAVAEGIVILRRNCPRPAADGSTVSDASGGAR